MEKKKKGRRRRRRRKEEEEAKFKVWIFGFLYGNYEFCMGLCIIGP